MTPRQKACLAAIRRLTKDGVAPTLEELRVELGHATKSSVHRLLVKLEEHGRIRRSPYGNRCIEVVEADAPPPPVAEPDVIARALVEAGLLAPADFSRATDIIAGLLR